MGECDSPTSGAVLVERVEVRVGDQLAPVDPRLDGAQATEHPHLVGTVVITLITIIIIFTITVITVITAITTTTITTAILPARHCRSWG